MNSGFKTVDKHHRHIDNEYCAFPTKFHSIIMNNLNWLTD